MAQNSQFQEAVPLYREAIRVNPGDPAAYFYLGVTYHALKDYESCDRTWDYLAAKFPQHYLNHLQQALRALKQNDHQAAMGFDDDERSSLHRRRPAYERSRQITGAGVAGPCGGRRGHAGPMRGTPDDDCYISLLPGPHSMSVQPMSLNGVSGPGYIAPTAATPGMYVSDSAYYLPVVSPVTVRYTVEAGHSDSLITDDTCVANPAATLPADQQIASTNNFAGQLYNTVATHDVVSGSILTNDQAGTVLGVPVSQGAVKDAIVGTLLGGVVGGYLGYSYSQHALSDLQAGMMQQKHVTTLPTEPLTALFGH